MKRILIAGEHSYIGTHLAAWLATQPDEYAVETLSLHGEDWHYANLAGVDAAVLVAGIAHQRETPENEPLYEAINHQLAVAFAARAKTAGVRQLLFISSMSVYGRTTGRIHADTTPTPNTAYGRSKLAAETELATMANDHFHVAILRPPMVYGPGCRGNYPRLATLIGNTPVFPRAQNERSMIYIDTLCACMEQLLQTGEGGLFFPQNTRYVRTAELAAQIARERGRSLWQPRGAGWLLRLLAPYIGVVGKVFGTLTYDPEMSAPFQSVEQLDFAETIRRTEAGA